MNLTEKRRSTLISAVYIAMFAVLYFLFIKFAFWIFFPFIIAFMVAMLLQRPIRFIARKTPISKKPVSVVLVLLIFILLSAVIGLVGYALVTQFADFFDYLRSKFSDSAAVIESIRSKIESVLIHFPKSISDYLRSTIDGMTTGILNLAEETEETAAAKPAGSFNFSILATPLSGILNTAKQIPAVLAAALVGIVACFFMTSDYSNLTALIKNNITDEHEKTLLKTKHIITDVLGKWCKSYTIVLFITFCEVFVGLNVLKFFNLYNGGYIAVIALCTALVDILPVFGTGTVMIPWALISLFTHKAGLGIGLIVIYILITVIRQVVEPKIVSSSVDIHPVITLISMYVGIQIFGVLGIFILPITVVVVKTLNDEGVIHLWTNKKAAAAADSDPPEVTAGDEGDTPSGADETAPEEAKVSAPAGEKEE